MSKTMIALIAAVVVLLVVSVVDGSRIAAGGGALLLIGALIYGYVNNRRGSPADVARAERGAHELREELDRRDNP